MRRDIDELFVSPEHSVLTRDYRIVHIIVAYILNQFQVATSLLLTPKLLF